MACRIRTVKIVRKKKEEGTCRFLISYRHYALASLSTRPRVSKNNNILQYYHFVGRHMYIGQPTLSRPPCPTFINLSVQEHATETQKGDPPALPPHASSIRHVGRSELDSYLDAPSGQHHQSTTKYQYTPRIFFSFTLINPKKERLKLIPILIPKLISKLLYAI